MWKTVLGAAYGIQRRRPPATGGATKPTSSRLSVTIAPLMRRGVRVIPERTERRCGRSRERPIVRRRQLDIRVQEAPKSARVPASPAAPSLFPLKRAPARLRGDTALASPMTLGRSLLRDASRCRSSMRSSDRASRPRLRCELTAADPRRAPGVGKRRRRVRGPARGSSRGERRLHRPR